MLDNLIRTTIKIPKDTIEIKCKIRTIQHLGDENTFYFLVQKGIFNRDTLIFEGNNHKVFFKSFQDFKSSLVKIYI